MLEVLVCLSGSISLRDCNGLDNNIGVGVGASWFAALCSLRECWLGKGKFFRELACLNFDGLCSAAVTLV